MNIVFLGTPRIAVPTMEKLHAAGHNILLAVSQPDRPSGRGQKTVPTPVKQKAVELGIPVFQPENVNAPEAVQRIAALRPDIIVVVAFGQILKQTLLDVPPKGCVNLHASLLPLLRGAAPINRAIMEGHMITGVATMKMDRRMDAGGIYLNSEIPIGTRMTAGELHDAVMTTGAALMGETLRRIDAEDFEPIPQDESGATFAPKITPEERPVDWGRPAEQIDRQIRGLSPSPAAFTFFGGKRILLLRSNLGDANNSLPPGTVGSVPEGLAVGTGNGTVWLLEVRPEGKKAMQATDWSRGVRLSATSRFENR
ncbi:MAG: methionyl-tRNA formyltransferase [Nitrospinae bacterium]|nr:methionyl-tRNA formyltransferase [Nitrospinota bacterium]